MQLVITSWTVVVALTWVLVVANGASAAEQPIAFWSLDDGEGGYVANRVAERNGLLRAGGRLGDEGEAPQWIIVDGEPALSFPGGGVGGHVTVDRGGNLLSGPQFQIALDVWPDDAGQAASLLSCKFANHTDGGFGLSYWGQRRRLTFQFADGHRNYNFHATLPERLSDERWTSIRVTYDGRWLTMEADGETVERFHRPGLELTESRRFLTIGGYHHGSQAFAGRLRNVSLGVPDKPLEPNLAYTVTRTKTRPTIDGDLDDPVWQKAIFAGDFTTEQGRPADPATQFAAVRDDSHLYVAFRAAHPDPGTIATSDEASHEWVKLRLDPEFNQEYEIHAKVMAAGVIDVALRRPNGELLATDIGSEWEWATARTAEGWTAELAIPFGSLLVQPGESGSWLFNVARTSLTPAGHAQKSTWGRMEGDNPATSLRAFRGDLQAVYSPQQIQSVQSRRESIGLSVKPYQLPLALQPIADEMMIANNLTVPNWFNIGAPMRAVMEVETQFLLDLPKGVDLIGVGGAHVGSMQGGTAGWYTFEKLGAVTHDGQPYTRFSVAPVKQHPNTRRVGPLYFTTDLEDGVRTRIYYTSAWNGGETEPEAHPLQVRRFPTPGQPEGLYHNIGSNRAMHVLGWPQFMQSYGQLGFNGVSIHSKWDVAVGVEDHLRPLFDEARAHGYETLAWESPFIYHGHSLRIAPDGSPAAGACPTYRGEYYEQEIDRVVNIVVALRLDEILLDIESMSGTRGQTGDCLRCKAYVEQSGLPAREAMVQAGSEIIGDVRAALYEAWPSDAGDPPRIGVYSTQPGGIAYHELFDYDHLKAHGYVEFAMPVFYSPFRAQGLGEHLRELRGKLQGGYLYPWHQPGSVMEYPSPWVYDRVLENFGSGARGLTWYDFIPMEGADFFYAAKAMTAVRAVETVLADAAPASITYDAEATELHVSALRSGDDYVLLISAYDAPDKAAGTPVTITLPASATGQVWDLSRGEAVGDVTGRTLQLRWESGADGAHTNLYYVGQKQVALPGS